MEEEQPTSETQEGQPQEKQASDEDAMKKDIKKEAEEILQEEGEKPKKKRTWLYVLFGCLGALIIGIIITVVFVVIAIRNAKTELDKAQTEFEDLYAPEEVDDFFNDDFFDDTEESDF